MSNDPRFVALVSPSGEIGAVDTSRRRVWIRGGTPVTPNQKVQVIFCQGQVRLYPLDEKPAQRPPIMRVTADYKHVPNNLIIQSDQGITVFVPNRSRIQRARWQLQQLEAAPDSAAAHIDAISDILNIALHTIRAGFCSYDFSVSFSKCSTHLYEYIDYVDRPELNSLKDATAYARELLCMAEKWEAAAPPRIGTS